MKSTQFDKHYFDQMASAEIAPGLVYGKELILKL